MKPFFFIVMFPLILFSENLDSQKVFSYANAGNAEGLSRIFTNINALSINQANFFLNSLAKKIRETYSSELEPGFLKEILWDIIDAENATDHQKQFVKNFFLKILNDSFQENKTTTHEYRFFKSLDMMTLGIRYPFYQTSRTEISSGVIIGAVETLAGALLFLTPLRAVGTGMMVDGVRRMLNAVENEEAVHRLPSEQ